LCALFDLILDSFYVNMTIEFHPTHLHALLHTHMIVGNFP